MNPRRLGAKRALQHYRRVVKRLKARWGLVDRYGWACTAICGKTIILMVFERVSPADGVAYTVHIGSTRLPQSGFFRPHETSTVDAWCAHGWTDPVADQWNMRWVPDPSLWDEP